MACGRSPFTVKDKRLIVDAGETLCISSTDSREAIVEGLFSFKISVRCVLAAVFCDISRSLGSRP